MGLAFDLIDGDGVSNIVMLSNPMSDGHVSTVRTYGDVTVSGDNSVSMHDAQFLNGILYGLSRAKNLSVSFSGTNIAPHRDAFADSLAAFLVDLETGLPIMTTDPVGAGALFAWILDGSVPQVYQPLDIAGLGWTVQDSDAMTLPLPSTLALFGIGLALLLMRSRGLWLPGLLFLAGNANAVDLTGVLSLTKSGFIYNRQSDTYDTQVIVRNTAAYPVTGPLRLVINNTRPLDASLYHRDGALEDGREFVELPLQNGLLESQSQAKYILKVMNPNKRSISMDLSVDGTPLEPGNRAMIRIRAFHPAGDNGDLKGPPVGAGYLIRVDDYPRLLTDFNGQATLPVSVTAQQVSVTRPPNAAGSAMMEGLRSNETRTIDVIVGDGGEIYAEARLSIRELRGQILSAEAPIIHMSFQRSGQEIRLAAIVDARMWMSDGTTVDLRKFCELLPDGTMRLVKNEAYWKETFNFSGRLKLRIDAQGIDGLPYSGTVTFYDFGAPVRVQLRPSFSNPYEYRRTLEGIRVDIEVLGTDLRYTAITGADGSAITPLIPCGLARYRASQRRDGFWIQGDTIAPTCEYGLRVNISMCDPEVLRKLCPPGWVETHIFELAPSKAPGIKNGRPVELISDRTESQSDLTGTQALAVTVSKTGSAIAQVVSKAPNELEQVSAQLDVPKGTKMVRLSYRAATQEYPKWVKMQSQFNDAWGVQVYSQDNSLLFDSHHLVNAQLAGEPMWQNGGDTGEIYVDLDVTTLGAEKDTKLGLLVRAMNIGDDRYPTSVSAMLTPIIPLAITKIIPDTVRAKNDGTYYSLPSNGESNHLQRRFTLEIVKPQAAKLKSLEVAAVDSTGRELLPILRNVEPDSDGVQLIEESEIKAVLKVRVTFDGDVHSTLPTGSPIVDTFGYRFQVNAEVEGNPLSAEKVATSKHALWRMPQGIARFGSREPGGDDWVAQGTYRWIEENQEKLTGINDVSGEHGRNLEHATHARGTDIDMHHFYVYEGVGSGPGSGTANYLRLQQDGISAFDTDLRGAPTPAALAARTRLSAWIQATRGGLRDLLELPEVSEVYYCLGQAHAGLGTGWCQTLLSDGVLRLSLPGRLPRELILDHERFTSSKLRHNSVHDNHVHVTLDPIQLAAD
jgi:hypothetical protein